MSLREDALSQLDRFKATIPGYSPTTCGSTTSTVRRRGVQSRDPWRSTTGSCLPARNPRPSSRRWSRRCSTRCARAGWRSARARRRPRRRGHAGRRPRGDAVPAARHAAALDGRDAAGRAAVDAGALDELGGAERIVSQHLDEALAALGPDRERLAAELFAFLVTPSKTKIAQAPSDLAYWTHRPVDEVTGVLRELAVGERRILRSVPPPSATPRASSATRYSTTSWPSPSASGAPATSRCASARNWPPDWRRSAAGGPRPSAGVAGRSARLWARSCWPRWPWSRLSWRCTRAPARAPSGDGPGSGVRERVACQPRQRSRAQSAARRASAAGARDSTRRASAPAGGRRLARPGGAARPRFPALSGLSDRARPRGGAREPRDRAPRPRRGLDRVFTACPRGSGRQIVVWDPVSGRTRRVGPAWLPPSSSVSFSPDGRHMLAGARRRVQPGADRGHRSTAGAVRTRPRRCDVLARRTPGRHRRQARWHQDRRPADAARRAPPAHPDLGKRSGHRFRRAAERDAGRHDHDRRRPVAVARARRAGGRAARVGASPTRVSLLRWPSVQTGAWSRRCASTGSRRPAALPRYGGSGRAARC